MSNDRYASLGYTHYDIQFMLDKIYKGYVLKEDEYKKLFEMGIDNLSTFSGDYNDLTNKPDLIIEVQKALETNGIETKSDVDEKLNQLIESFNSHYEKIDQNIRTDMAIMEMEIYDLMGEKPPGQGESYDVRVTRLEQSSAMFSEELRKILSIIEEPPVYVAPTISLSINPTRAIHNESTAFTITPNFFKNDGGDITSYILKKNNEVLLETSSLESYKDIVSLKHSDTITYTATVNYSAGPIKNTTAGNPYPETSIEAGSVSNNVSARCYAYSYYGVIDTDTVSEMDILNMNKVILTSRSNTVTYNLKEGQRSVFIYPNNYGLLTSIKDINNFNYIDSYNVTNMQYNGVNYNVYVLKDPVKIDGFKQIFT